MIKKLTKHGNSLALIIDRPILELLKISDDTSLEITTDGKVLVISPVNDEKRRRRFEKALTSVNAKHSRVLKKLAD